VRIQLQGAGEWVNYARKAPWLASRLQDFFGMRDTPRIAGGKVAWAHLLAPNHRGSDDHRPVRPGSGSIRKCAELCRRYPHAPGEDRCEAAEVK
jgi:ATP-dependent helicase HrpB